MQTGIISQSDYEKIVHGLELIRQEIEGGRFVFSRMLEDIHMNIESQLRELIGSVAGYLYRRRLYAMIKLLLIYVCRYVRRRRE